LGRGRGVGWCRVMSGVSGTCEHTWSTPGARPGAHLGHTGVVGDRQAGWVRCGDGAGLWRLRQMGRDPAVAWCAGLRGRVWAARMVGGCGGGVLASRGRGSCGSQSRHGGFGAVAPRGEPHDPRPDPSRPGADPQRVVGVDASGRAGGGQHDGTTDDSVVSHELDHRPRIHPQKCSPEHTIAPRAFRTCR